MSQSRHVPQRRPRKQRNGGQSARVSARPPPRTLRGACPTIAERSPFRNVLRPQRAQGFYRLGANLRKRATRGRRFELQFGVKDRGRRQAGRPWALRELARWRPLETAFVRLASEKTVLCRCKCVLRVSLVASAAFPRPPRKNEKRARRPILVVCTSPRSLSRRPSTRSWQTQSARRGTSSGAPRKRSARAVVARTLLG